MFARKPLLTSSVAFNNNNTVPSSYLPLQPSPALLIFLFFTAASSFSSRYHYARTRAPASYWCIENYCNDIEIYFLIQRWWKLSLKYFFLLKVSYIIFYNEFIINMDYFGTLVLFWMNKMIVALSYYPSIEIKSSQTWKKEN